MRKVLISLTAAGTALAFATPAAAQYFPAQQPYGYSHGYNNSGHVRALQDRINRVQDNINRLDRRDAIRDRTADRLRSESRSLERHLRSASRYGLNPREANDIERGVFNLERQVRVAMGQRWRNNYGFNGYNGYAYNSYDPHYSDRDRDGRNDRWEDDHGRDRDNR